MKTTERKSWFIWVAAIVTIAVPGQVLGQAAVESSRGRSGFAPQWTVQVEKVDSGHLDLAHSFQLAIYENLVQELNQTKQFTQVLREGDRKRGRRFGGRALASFGHGFAVLSGAASRINDPLPFISALATSGFMKHPTAM